MLLLLALVIPSCCGALSSVDSDFQYSDLLDAADEIIRSSFKPNAVSINFIISLSDETKRRRNVLINNLVERCDIVYIEDIIVDVISQRQRRYNVIFIDDFKSFLRLLNQMTSDAFVIDGFFLVVFVKGPIPEVAEIAMRLWHIFIHNVGFLFKDEAGIKLLTYLPFTETCNGEHCEKRCGDTTPVLVHNFTGSFAGSKKYFPEKISDLFQCPLKVVTFNSPPTMLIKYDANQNYDLMGIDGEMLKLLASIFNFKIDLIHISDLIRWGALYDNGTATGAMAMVINNEADLTLGMYTITYLRSLFMTSSEFYYSVPFVLIIPPGIPLSPFEKLFEPFQLAVWLLLLVVFITAFSVVTLVKCQSMTIRNYVFGERNKAPYLNILSGFTGVSMPLLPRKSFARTLLMIFLLFSIVKRTLYQAGLFQFIQADDRKKEVQSIDEVVERNFRVYMLPSSLEHTQNMKFREQRVVINSKTLAELKPQTIDPYFNAAVTSSMEQILYFNKLNHKNMTLTVCREQLFTFQYGIYFRKNSFLVEGFNKKISILKSSGLINFWAPDYIDSKFLKVKMRDESAKKLNVVQLLGGFEVLFIGFAFGFMALLCEIIAKCCRVTKLQNLIEFFT